MVGLKQTIVSACPMDCPDMCRFLVTVQNGKITGLKGDPEHPVTDGFVCKKGIALIKRHYHPDRILNPLIRTKSGFKKISYSEVFDLIADQLQSITDRYGPTTVLNYTCSGYGGLKAGIQNIFFNCIGGATVPEGSLCWGAGIAAQRYDFGTSKGNFPDDVENAALVIVWGRNPAETNLHLFKRLKTVKKKGGRVVVIDPVRTLTARNFDDYLRVRPDTDTAIALTMAKVIVEEDLFDRAFTSNHVLGFNRFKAYLSTLSHEQLEAVTGIHLEQIRSLAREYALAKQATIYIGWGIQRYRYGGNTVRAIDALGAITGKIGKQGCSVNYASKGISPYIHEVQKNSLTRVKNLRPFITGKLGKFLEEADEPVIKAAFVSGANPLNQSPDLVRTVREFKKIPFKVVFDHFMTDTARHADIILPAATVFEQEDVIAGAMYSPIVNYANKVVEPAPGIMPEFDFYLELGKRLDDLDLGFDSSMDFLEKSVAPLIRKLGITFDMLKDKQSYIRLPEDDLPWNNKEFLTPSGKYELFSENAQKNNLSAMPVLHKPQQPDSQLPLRFLTCHTKNSLHSQGFAFEKRMSEVFIHPDTAVSLNLQDGEKVDVKGKDAKIKAVLRISKDICKNTAFMYQGWWHESGAVNFLTEPHISDMGDQAAYYDSFVDIGKGS